MNLEPGLIPYMKINSRWIMDLNVNGEIIKLLKYSKGKLPWSWKDFSNKTPKQH